MARMMAFSVRTGPAEESRKMTNFALVQDAIESRRQIHAYYRGHRREMCPHVLGWKHGRPQALFYQFGGTSSSGLGPDGSRDNWRCLPIDELRDVRVVDGPWHTATNHSRPQTCVGDVVAEVDY
jgi:hypothetical protein